MKLLVTIVLGFASLVPAWAGSFNVSPIKIELTPAKPTQAITLSNEGDEDVLIQVQPMLWTQQNWKDVHTTTDQVIATPPLVRIPAHSHQIVRIGLRRPIPAGTEGTFRLFLTEMPAPTKAEEVGLQVSLRLDLPLFVTTTNKLRPDLQWSVARDENGVPQVVVANAGSAHVQLSELRIWQGEQVIVTPQPNNAYVLPGATRRWPLVDSQRKAVESSSLRLRATADNGTVDVQINTDLAKQEADSLVKVMARD